MWRQITRRALHCRRDPSVKLLTSIVPKTPNEAIALALPSIECSCNLFRRSNICSYARFFSSNPAENYEEPANPDANGSNVWSNFGATDKFDESTKSDLENEDSVFEGAGDNWNLNEGLGVDLEGTSGIEEHDPSLEVNDGIGIVDEVKENDPEKIEGLLSLLQSSGDPNKSMESGFEVLGLLVDEELLSKVLEAPNVSAKNLVDFFGWVVKKPEFKLSTHLVDAVFKAVRYGSSTKELCELWDLLKIDDNKGVFSTECLNGFIEEFMRMGKGKIAYEIFNKFEDLGCALNADTYYFTIEALCKRSLYHWANLVCEKMLSDDKLPRNAERVGQIMSHLCKGGMAKEAHLVYLSAKDYEIYPSLSSVDFLISSLSRLEKGNKKTGKEVDKERDRETVSSALAILEDYPAENRKYANKPFSNVVKKLCWIEDIDRAKKLLQEMIETGPAPGNEAFNCVINGLTKLGDMNEATNLLQKMKSRGLKPDVYTYSVIMSGYMKTGEIEEACKIFEEAKKKHSKLTPVTYHTMIRGFCRVEQFDKAVDLVREMRQHGVTPSHDEYNKLIKSLCFRALDWETAEKLRNEMEKNGVILNGRTAALIRAVKELKEDASAQ